MKAMLYMPNREEPVAVLDEVSVVEYNDNHKRDPLRIYYKSQKIHASRVMTEMFRDEKMRLQLEDGRSADVLIQHNSLDTEGRFVGVLRLIGGLKE
jgi:hypothetical protein